MAIEFARATIHSRSKGHSAVAAAAYRAGVKLKDERTGEIRDFSKRQDVAYSEIMLPEGTDSKFEDREALWNAVEFAEKRKDSQVGKDIVLALPKELSLTDQIKMARNFAEYHFVSKGIMVDLNIHADPDGVNNHAHLYIPTRRVLGNKLDRYKARDLNPSFANWSGGKGFVSEQDYWGKTWAGFQNGHFKSLGLSIRVDEKQILSQRHEGRVRNKDEHYIREENELRREASVEIAINDPAALLNEIGSRHTVFSEREIKAIILKNTDDPAQFDQAYNGLLRHNDLVALGPGDDGRMRYTTRANYQREAVMADRVDALFLQKKHAVSFRHVKRAMKKHGLNEEQADALAHLSERHGISAIVGRAGTGKSYMMRAARDMWEASGYRVVGMAFSGKAASGLQQGSGIRSRTIAYYKHRILKGSFKFNEKDVVVMDEAGMTNLDDMSLIVEAAKKAGAKLVLIGDHAQLQPVGRGAPFRALVERIGFAEMNHIMRQTDEYDRKATLALSKGDVGSAIDHYMEMEKVHLLDPTQKQDKKNGAPGNTTDEQPNLVHQKLIDDWSSLLNQTEIHNQVITAFQNDQVADLNNLARQRLIRQGVLLGKAHDLKTTQGTKMFFKRDRVVFLRNDISLGLSNGDFGTIKSIRGDKVTVILDGQEKPVTFSVKDYNAFDYGYAATVHKLQGATFENVFVLAGNYWDRFLTYVALSRHKEHVSLYASKEDFKDIDQLKQKLGRYRIKDNVLDFWLSFAIRRGYDPDKMLGQFIDKVAHVKRQIKDKWLWVSNYEAYALSQKQQWSKAHSQQTRQKAIAVAEFTDLHREVGKVWNDLKKVYPDKKMLYGSDEYKAFYELLRQRNQFAPDILVDAAQCKTALELNSIKLNTIKNAAETHYVDQNTFAYAEAYKAGNTLLRHQYADSVYKGMDKHYGIVAYAAKEAGLSLPDFKQAIRRDSVYQQFNELYLKSSTDERKTLSNARRYYQKERALKELWSMVYRYADDDGKLTHLSKEQLQSYLKRKFELDQLASKIYTNFNQYEKVADVFQLDEHQLSGLHERHTLRNKVKEYQSTLSSMTREQLAAEVLSDRHYYRYVFEQDVDWKQLYKEKDAFNYKQKLLSLLPSERKDLQHILRYRDARIAAGRAWSTFLGDKDPTKPLDAAQQKYCWSLTEVRNRLAYQIALDPKKYAAYLADTNIKLADIKKHAIAYSKQLQRQQKYLAAKKQVDFRKSEKQHSQMKQQQVIPPAYDKTKQRWRYDVVNDALLAMGENLYERILGFEGKREGGHHLRFGQGHALLYSFSGDKMGSWHSFSSGEGGGPIQLLMSRTHGWGLSYEDAVREGARLAGLSEDQAIVVRTPVKAPKAINVNSQSAEDERQSKISSARYYYNSAESIKGTLGEKYLREVRGIQGDIGEVKYHPRIRDTYYDDEKKKHVSYHPGIVVAAKDAQGNIMGSQTILLDSKTGEKIDKNTVGAVKRSRGEIKGSAVLVHQGKSNQVILAEGNETALSLIQAAPDANIYVTLGNIKNAESLAWLAEKHQSKAIYFAADNDLDNQKNIDAIKSIAKTYKHEYGIDTYLSKPRLPINEKHDFNDVLKQKGIDEVKKQLHQWEKINTPEQERFINEKEISDNLEKVDTSSGNKKSAFDRALEKRQAAFDALLEKERQLPQNKAIFQYERLLSSFNQAKNDESRTAYSHQLDKAAVHTYKDKYVMKQITASKPKLAELIVKRAKHILAKSHGLDNDIDIDIDIDIDL